MTRSCVKTQLLRSNLNRNTNQILTKWCRIQIIHDDLLICWLLNSWTFITCRLGTVGTSACIYTYWGWQVHTNTVCKCLEWSSVLDSTCRCCVLVLLMKSFTERPASQEFENVRIWKIFIGPTAELRERKEFEGTRACTRVVASDVLRCLPNTKQPLHSLYFDFQHHGFSKPFCRLSRRYWQLIVLIRVLCATFVLFQSNFLLVGPVINAKILSFLGCWHQNGPRQPASLPCRRLPRITMWECRYAQIPSSMIC